jgi:hypothetical protein
VPIVHMGGVGGASCALQHSTHTHHGAQAALKQADRDLEGCKHARQEHQVPLHAPRQRQQGNHRRQWLRVAHANSTMTLESGVCALSGGVGSCVVCLLAACASLGPHTA